VLHGLPIIFIPSFKTGARSGWITGYDSTGQWRFFSRPIGAHGPFYNEFAGKPDDPRSTCGNGEAIDEFGNRIIGFIPSVSYRRFLVGLRFRMHKAKRAGV
jgi:hypothetical protein